MRCPRLTSRGSHRHGLAWRIRLTDDFGDVRLCGETVTVLVGPSNVALTVVVEVSVTVHVPVPEQPPPLHPANVEPEAGAAVRVTVEP